MLRPSIALISALASLVPLAAAAETKLAEVTPNEHIRGDRSAAASLVVYSDFQCPFCKKFHATLETVRGEYPHIRIVYRNFPLAMHALALPAARAAECVARAKGDEGYWPFLDGLFALKSLTEPALRQLAVEQGAEGSAFDNCLPSAAVAETIDADKASGKLAGVTGTPTSFLIKPDGTAVKITGAVSADTLKKHLDKVEKPAAQTDRNARVETTKRKARVRPAVKGVRRWK